MNRGGHPAGSAFELVSWSQGELLHNTWYSKGKDNVPASAERKRMLYLVGLGVELETALRAVGKATARKPYAFEMAKRADAARKQLDAAAKAAPNVPEIATMVEFANSAGLKLNNESPLTAAADGVSKLLVRITETYDGSTMAGLDSMRARIGAKKDAAPVKAPHSEQPIPASRTETTLDELLSVGWTMPMPRSTVAERLERAREQRRSGGFVPLVSH